MAFSSKGDRIAWTQVEQMIDGKYNKIAYYDTQTDNLTWLTQPRWIEGKIPQDRTIIIGIPPFSSTLQPFIYLIQHVIA